MISCTLYYLNYVRIRIFVQHLLQIPPFWQAFEGRQINLRLHITLGPSPQRFITVHLKCIRLLLDEVTVVKFHALVSRSSYNWSFPSLEIRDFAHHWIARYTVFRKHCQELVLL